MKLVLSLCGILLAQAGCSLDIPAQVATVTFTEQITQRFLVAENAKRQSETTYLSLVGEDAARVLQAVHGTAVDEAAAGTLAVRGSVVLTARLDPFDKQRYILDGHGQFDIYTLQGGRELIISADFDAGGPEEHRLEELRSLQIVVPIHHRARLNPLLLLGRTVVNEKNGECGMFVHSLSGPGRDWISCMAAGVGSPFESDYYVRVHLKEVVEGKVYGLDRARPHEVFRRNGGKFDVFGCLTVYGGAGASQLMDLRGLKFLGSLPRVDREEPRSAGYDHFDVPDRCRER